MREKDSMEEKKRNDRWVNLGLRDSMEEKSRSNRSERNRIAGLLPGVVFFNKQINPFSKSTDYAFL
jgi:hypothetical protein